MSKEYNLAGKSIIIDDVTIINGSTKVAGTTATYLEEVKKSAQQKKDTQDVSNRVYKTFKIIASPTTLERDDESTGHQIVSIKADINDHPNAVPRFEFQDQKRICAWSSGLLRSTVISDLESKITNHTPFTPNYSGTGSWSRGGGLFSIGDTVSVIYFFSDLTYATAIMTVTSKTDSTITGTVTAINYRACDGFDDRDAGNTKVYVPYRNLIPFDAYLYDGDTLKDSLSFEVVDNTRNRKAIGESLVEITSATYTEDGVVKNYIEGDCYVYVQNNTSTGEKIATVKVFHQGSWMTLNNVDRTYQYYDVILTDSLPSVFSLYAQGTNHVTANGYDWFQQIIAKYISAVYYYVAGAIYGGKVSIENNQPVFTGKGFYLGADGKFQCQEATFKSCNIDDVVAKGGTYNNITIETYDETDPNNPELIFKTQGRTPTASYVFDNTGGARNLEESFISGGNTTYIDPSNVSKTIQSVNCRWMGLVGSAESVANTLIRASWTDFTFIAPVTGTYQFTGGVTFSGSSGQNRNVTITVNGQSTTGTVVEKNLTRGNSVSIVYEVHSTVAVDSQASASILSYVLGGSFCTPGIKITSYLDANTNTTATSTTGTKYGYEIQLGTFQVSGHGKLAVPITEIGQTYYNPANLNTNYVRVNGSNPTSYAYHKVTANTTWTNQFLTLPSFAYHELSSATNCNYKGATYSITKFYITKSSTTITDIKFYTRTGHAFTLYHDCEWYASFSFTTKLLGSGILAPNIYAGVESSSGSGFVGTSLHPYLEIHSRRVSTRITKAGSDSWVDAGAGVIEEGISGNNWYRLWSDGWIEQGGHDAGHGPNWSITFPTPFSNANYVAIGIPIYQSTMGGTGFAYSQNTKVSTGITFSGYEEWWGGIDWYACGY